MSDNDKRIIKVICKNQKHIILINIILFAIGVIATFSCFLNMVISSNEKYIFKKEFKLVSAIKTSHIGNPAKFQETIMGMQKYITENNLKPITSLYNVTINEAKSPSEVDDLHIDLYLGITPNIL